MAPVQSQATSLRWQRLCGPLVRWRHPVLLSFVLLQTWLTRSPVDWPLLTNGARALTGRHPLSTYVDTTYLQCGPTGLLVVRVFDLLPGHMAEATAHLALGALGWLLLYLVERWSLSGPDDLARKLTTLAAGLPVLQIWTFLAGGAPHPEDGLALLTFVLAVRAVRRDADLSAGLLVALTVSWKPWGVVALPLVLGLSRRRRALLIAVLGPAVCWLPFLLGDPATLHAISHGFELQPDSTLRMLGFSARHVPQWWRSMELLAALTIATVAAVRRGWSVAFAAGCAARLLFDPAGFDYYVAGLVLATLLTETLSRQRPWRTVVLTVGLVEAQIVLSPAATVPLRFVVLMVVLASWLVPQPDRQPVAGARLRPAAQERVGPALVPAPRDGEEPVRETVSTAGPRRPDIL